MINKKKGSILVLTSTFPRSNNDWWGRFVFDIYAHVNKTAWEVVILAPHAPGAKHVEHMGNIKVVRFSYFYPFSNQKLTTGAGVLYSSRKSVIGLLQIGLYILSQLIYAIFLVIKKRPKLIHAHWILPQGFIAAICKFVFHVPVIISVHGTDIFTFNRFTKIKLFVLKHADCISVNSTETQKAVRKIWPEAPVIIIPMGVDTHLFAPRKKRTVGTNKTLHKPVILGVGRFIPWKGFDYLIEAFSRVRNTYKNAQLLLVGSGPEENNLKNKVERLGLILNKDVVFLGNLSRQKLAHLFSTADVFVSSSITDTKTGEREAQGVVIIEAMAAGVPVVANKSGGIGDIVDGTTTGLLAKEKDSSDLARNITRILRDQHLQHTLAIHARRLVEKKYSWISITKQFESLYDRMIE